MTMNLKSYARKTGKYFPVKEDYMYWGHKYYEVHGKNYDSRGNTCWSEYGAMLLYGEDIEQLVADMLTDGGLPTYRPTQRFIDPWLLKDEREQGYCELSDRHACSRKDLLRKQQRDLLFKLDKSRRGSIEVKVRDGRAFGYADIHVGCCPKWDDKKFHVDYLILINGDTGDVYVIPPMVGWVRRPSLKKANEIDYAIPRQLLSIESIWSALYNRLRGKG
jgi:hypothetical protein